MNASYRIAVARRLERDLQAYARWLRAQVLMATEDALAAWSEGEGSPDQMMREATSMHDDVLAIEAAIEAIKHGEHPIYAQDWGFTR